jgi:hypothetical protein
VIAHVIEQKGETIIVASILCVGGVIIQKLEKLSK